MSNINAVLRQLAAYIDTSLTLQQIEEILDDDESSDKAIVEMGIVQTARSQPAVLNLLLELCTECRAAREGNVLPNEHDSWENLSATIEPDHLLAYLSCLIELAHINPNDPINRRLSMIGSRAYLLLLTVPGAKAVGAFEPNLIERTIRMVDLLKIMANLREHDRINILINSVSLLEDVQLLLRYVSFDEEITLTRAVIRCICVIMLFYHESSSHDMFQLYDSCYGVLENLCLPVQGDISDSLMRILEGTFRLNRFTVKTMQSTNRHQRSVVGAPMYSSIQCWFIEMLSKFPVQAATVMQQFVQSTLTDCTAPEQERQVDLDISVRYVNALFRVGNASALDTYLERLATSSDAQHRVNLVDLVTKILQLDTERDRSIIASESTLMSREITFVRMLLVKASDQNNRVKIRATNALLSVSQHGNEKCIDIIKFLFSNSIESARNHISQKTIQITVESNCAAVDSSATASASNDESSQAAVISSHPLAGIEELWPHKSTFLRTCNQNLVNSLAYVRKAALATLLFLASIGSTVNVETLLSAKEFQMLHLDASPMIRRQLVTTMSDILDVNKSNDQVIDAYVRICLNMTKDDDPKVVEAIMTSLKQNLFDNIVPYSETSSEKHRFPWRLLSSMLCSHDSLHVTSCLKSSVGRNLITPRILSDIETHISTTNSTEAWTLLCMVAPKISSKNPEIVVAELLKNVQTDGFHFDAQENRTDNSYQQLEVLACWMDDLSRYSQCEVLRIMTDLLMEGCVNHQIVPRMYEVCYRICQKTSAGELQRWVTKLRNRSETYVIKHIRTIGIPELYNSQLIGYLYTYVETVTGSQACNLVIIDALLEYLKVLEQHSYKDLKEKVNAVQIVLTKLSLFDYDICLKTVPTIGNVLSNCHCNSITLNAIICLIDLCKRHTSQVEVVLPLILSKTRHDYYHIRQCALEGIASLLLEDYLKFRGPILIHVLAALTDERIEIGDFARELIVKHIVERNNVLLRSCLLECPFVLNAYMYHDNLEMFADTDDNAALPLTGDVHLLKRQHCYRFFIANISTVDCYMYFENAHMLLDKVSHDPQIRTPEGLAAVLDLLYILSQICQMKESSQKKSVVSTVDRDGGSDDDGAITNEVIVASASKVGGRNKTATIEQALVVVEKVIPTISSLNAKLRAIDASLFSAPMDELCVAICEHFPVLTELAQPLAFWRKYRKTKLPVRQLAAKSVLCRDPNGSSSLSSEDGENVERNATDARRRRPTRRRSTVKNCLPVNEQHIAVLNADESSDRDSDDNALVRLQRKRTKPGESQ